MENEHDLNAKQLPSEQDADATIAQMRTGLWLERLGRLEEAEDKFREILVGEPSYETRFSVVAVHSFGVEPAEVHHALARVLQRRGNSKEAWLHYHLAKRIYPAIQLDPMYREIISETDLENHPDFDSYDRRRPSKPSADAEFSQIIQYILSLPSLQNISSAIHDFGLERKKELLVRYIRVGQKAGHFLASANLRLLADLADGQEARCLHEGLTSNGWRELLKYAEALFANNLSESEIAVLAPRTDIYSTNFEALYRLVTRFVRLDPETGIFVAKVFDATIDDRSPRGGAALAKELLGKTFFRLRDYAKAMPILEQALVESEAALDEETWVNGEAAMEAVALLIEMCSKENQISIGLTLAERGVCLAERLADSQVLLRALFNNTRALAFAGDFKAALDMACKAVSVPHDTDTSDEICRQMLGVARSLSTELGIPLPADVACYDESNLHAPEAKRQWEEARTALQAGDLESARALLERACDRSLEEDDIGLHIAALYDLGRLEYNSGNFEKSKDLLQDAVRRAEPIASDLDFWPMLMSLASVCESLHDQTNWVDYLEKALDEARRAKDPARQAETHHYLSRALHDQDPDRAMWHFDSFLTLNRGDDVAIEDSEIRDAITTRQFSRARPALERRVAGGGDLPREKLAAALVNLGICEYGMEDIGEAIEHWDKASALFAEIGHNSAAIDALEKSVLAQLHSGREATTNLDRLLTLWRQLSSPGPRRSQGVRIAGHLAQAQRVGDAEQVARDCLGLAASEDWRDLGDELEARAILGKIFRISGRYSEAQSEYGHAIEIAKRLNNEPEEGRLCGWLAVALKYSGNFDAAFERFERALAICVKFGNYHEAAGNHLNYASALFAAGRIPEGLDHSISALAGFDAVNDEIGAGRTLLLAKNSVESSALPAAFAARLSQMDATVEVSSDPAIRSMSLYRRALKLTQAQQWSEAWKVAGSMIELNRLNRDPFNEANSYLNRAHLFASKDPVAAEQDILAARQLADTIGQRQLIAECDEFLLAQAIQIDNEPAVQECLSRLCPEWLELRRRLFQDLDRINFSDRVSKLAERAAAFYLRRGDLVRAFEMFEWCRGQALSDLIASTNVSPAACNDGNLVQPEPTGKSPVILEGTETPRTKTDFGTIQAVLRLLPRTAVICMLSFAGDDLVALTVRSGEDAPVLNDLGVSRNDIRGWMQLFRHEMYELEGIGGVTWPRIAAEMIAPLCKRIEKNDLAIFVLEEDLQVLPLHALPFPDGDFLIDRAALCYVPSLTVLARLQARQAKKTSAPSGQNLDILSIGVAFPDEALAVHHEVGGVALTGNYLSKSQLRETLEDARIVHFSCHGYFDKEIYLESGLLLAATEVPTRDMILSVRDIKSWQLHSDLITLSACESGLGEVSVTEFLGLTRAFLAAGCSAVIPTLWRVPARPTLELMLELYSRINKQLKTCRNLDLAEVLRQVQSDCLHKGKPISDWAGFQLVGLPILTNELSTHD